MSIAFKYFSTPHRRYRLPHCLAHSLSSLITLLPLSLSCRHFCHLRTNSVKSCSATYLYMQSFLFLPFRCLSCTCLPGCHGTTDFNVPLLSGHFWHVFAVTLFSPHRDTAVIYLSVYLSIELASLLFVIYLDGSVQPSPWQLLSICLYIYLSS